MSESENKPAVAGELPRDEVITHKEGRELHDEIDDLPPPELDDMLDDMLDEPPAPMNAEQCAEHAKAHGWTWDGKTLVHHEGFPVHDETFEGAVNRMAGRPVK